MKFQDYLTSIEACEPAVEWNGDRDLETCWQECERGDWMLWLMQNAKMCDIRTLTLAKAKCAELAKPHMKDERSLRGLQAAFDFAAGRISGVQLADAASAASAAYASASAAYASADAAYAAAAAAYAADASAYAAYAASAAADDAAYASAAYAAADAADARRSTLLLCANLCREVLPKPMIKNVK